MKSKLSPELQDVQDRFLDNLSTGGVEAAKQLVDELSLEIRTYTILYDEVESIESGKTVVEVHFDPWSETDKTGNMLELNKGIRNEAKLSYSRLALGLSMLDEVRTRQ